MKQALLSLLMAAAGFVGAGPATAEDLLYVSPASGAMQIYLLPDGATTGRQLTQGPGDSDNASWSPDGRLIAFVSRREGQPQVFVMNADGSAQRRVSGASDMSGIPAWSADSRRLAYPSHRKGSHGIHAYDIASGTETQLVDKLPENAASLAWSPAGDQLAFMGVALGPGERKADLHLLDLKTGTTRALGTPADVADSRPLWSPDGQRLAFVRAGGRKGIHLYVLDAGASAPRALTTGIHAHFGHSWSPDGRYLAFASNHESGERDDIYVIDVASGDLRNLSRHPHEDFEPAWSADGRSVYFVSFRSGTSQLYRAALDGPPQKVTTSNSYEGTPLPRPRPAGTISTAQSATTQDQGN